MFCKVFFCVGVTWLVASEGAKSALGIRVPLLCAPYNAVFLIFLSLHHPKINFENFRFLLFPLKRVSQNFFLFTPPKNNFENFRFSFFPLKRVSQNFFLFTPPKINFENFRFLFFPPKRVSQKLFFSLYTAQK